MGNCLFMRKGETHTAPVTGIQLGDIAEGSIVKLNESGSPVEFYVSKHDYESALNGTGRTLLVRKDCYDKRVWDAINTSTLASFAGSDIEEWLNGTYKSLFDAVTLSAIGDTTFYSTVGGGDSTVSTLERSIFLLSCYEYGISQDYYKKEGTTLPIASTLKIAKLNGSAVIHWTRTPRYSGQGYVGSLGTSGSVYNDYARNSAASRPCFTFPSGACFDEETMLFNGKIA